MRKIIYLLLSILLLLTTSCYGIHSLKYSNEMNRKGENFNKNSGRLTSEAKEKIYDRAFVELLGQTQLVKQEEVFDGMLFLIADFISSFRYFLDPTIQRLIEELGLTDDITRNKDLLGWQLSKKVLTRFCKLNNIPKIIEDSEQKLKMFKHANGPKIEGISEQLKGFLINMINKFLQNIRFSIYEIPDKLNAQYSINKFSKIEELFQLIWMYPEKHLQFSESLNFSEFFSDIIYDFRRRHTSLFLVPTICDVDKNCVNHCKNAIQIIPVLNPISIQQLYLEDETLIFWLASYTLIQIEDRLELLEIMAKSFPPKIMNSRNPKNSLGDTLATFIICDDSNKIADKLKLLEFIATNYLEIMNLRVGKEKIRGWAGYTLSTFIVAYPRLEIEDKLKLLKKVRQYSTNAFRLLIGEESIKYAGCTLLTFITLYDKPESIKQRQLLQEILAIFPNLIQETPDWNVNKISAFLNLDLKLSKENEQYLKNLLSILT